MMFITNKSTLIKNTMLTAFFTVTAAEAAAPINYLTVKGDAVHFSIDEAKSGTRPSCALATTSDHYAVSLKTDTGRAMYSILVAAMAGKQAVGVESAEDCADVAGLERAYALSIAPVNEVEETGKVKWVGYTAKVQGNISSATPLSKGPFRTFSKTCANTYPGSRAMLWDDYVSLYHSYPNSENIWFFDAIDQVSNSISDDGHYTYSDLVMFKDGQSIYQVQEWYENLISGGRIKSNLSCKDWASANQAYNGIVMGTNGQFSLSSCYYAYSIACVK